MAALDDFTLSHTSEPVRLPEESEVRECLPPREPLPFKLEPGSYFSVGNLGPDEVTMELRWYVWRAMERAKHVIREVSVDYARRFDRSAHSLVEEFKTGDARYLVVLAGAWSGDAMEAADMLGDEGYPVGVARLRYIRPFPAEELRELATSVRAVLVIDRAVSMGHTGVIAGDLVAATRGKVVVKNIIAGLGGVDMGPEDFKSIIKGFVEEYESGALDSWFYTEWYMPWVRGR